MNDFRILDLAGSLRRASLHRGLIRAARELAPEGVAVEPYEKLGEIPFFNQDVEDEGNPAPVGDPKEKIREADAILIATPEYDYAIPGILTATLDWALAPPPPCATNRWASLERARVGRERRGARWCSARSSCTPPPTSCLSPRCSSPSSRVVRRGDGRPDRRADSRAHAPVPQRARPVGGTFRGASDRLREEHLTVLRYSSSGCSGATTSTISIPIVRKLSKGAIHPEGQARSLRDSRVQMGAI